jgi:hypothetical protein
VFGNQNGFKKDHSSTDPASYVKLTERRRGFNVETHLAFIDYEKVLDKFKHIYFT